ncbi:MAG: glycosyltransferase family 2 protein, partial [Thermonemataceae bacterium]|nr:glycosyltransferase family 2 protein [Thermonemataceae bacterium]
MKVSVSIITLNEEKNIARCLESLQGIADEIVVVDSYSTDQTKQICEKYQVKFIEQNFLGYVAQKNFADAQTKYDWILSLDADETLSEKLRTEILYLKQNTPSNEAYQMPRLTNYIGKWIKHTDWYTDKKIRLYKKNIAKWEGKDLHEQIATQVAIGTLKGDILHYSYYSISQHITQLNKFTDIAAKEAQQRGKKAPLFKVFLNPLWKFIYSYFLRLGFLDGYKGFLVCAISAFATFSKYIKIK